MSSHFAPSHKYWSSGFRKWEKKRVAEGFCEEAELKKMLEDSQRRVKESQGQAIKEQVRKENKRKFYYDEKKNKSDG